MTDMFQDPIFTKGKIINTENEKKFHQELLERIGMDIKRSFCDIYISKQNKELGYDGEHICIRLDLLGKDNEKWNLHRTLSLDEPIAEIIWDLFDQYLLPQYLNDNLKAKFNVLPKRKEIYLKSLDLWMPRLTIDKTILKVNRVIRLLFPAQKKAVYNWHEKDKMQTHFFIYQEKSGLEKDIAKGNTEKMRKIAYKILKTKDYFNYFTPENYQPVFTCAQDLSSDEVLGITRENLSEIPWVGYRGY
ncbi:MAG TPA: hypothetical protein PLD48_00075 [Bacillota bacterium]|nr:hypothetical protein [Bacillota bacterium]HPP85019.1 hypothetical protein [Bacillota bacterium]